MKLTSNFMIMRQKLDINYENYCIERVCFRLQTSDFRLQTLDFRLRTSDFRLWTLDFCFHIIFFPTIFNANI